MIEGYIAIQIARTGHEKSIRSLYPADGNAAYLGGTTDRRRVSWCDASLLFSGSPWQHSAFVLNARSEPTLNDLCMSQNRSVFRQRPVQ